MSRNKRKARLIRLLDQNPVYLLDKGVGTWVAGIRCHHIDAVFWRYRGKRLPARAAASIRRYDRYYRRLAEHFALIDSLCYSE